MVEEEEENNRNKPPQKNLEIMSIEALNDYISELNQEIDRATKEIKIKTEARAGANAIFTK